MVKKTVDEFDPGHAPDDWEFETVSESASKIIFDKQGDVFVGQYEGIQHIVPADGSEEFDLFVFRGTDGELYSINASYNLRTGMEKVETGQWCRITYVRDVDTRKGNPMKVYRIDVRK